jgi:hypothetical protein
LARLDQLQAFQYTQWFALDNVNADIRIQHVYQKGLSEETPYFSFSVLHIRETSVCVSLPVLLRGKFCPPALAALAFTPVLHKQHGK